MNSVVFKTVVDPFLAAVAILEKHLTVGSVSVEHQKILLELQRFLYTVYIEDEYIWEGPVEIHLKNLRFPGLERLKFSIQLLLNVLKVPEFYINAMIKIFQGDFPEKNGYTGIYQNLDGVKGDLPRELQRTYKGPELINMVIICDPGDYKIPSSRSDSCDGSSSRIDSRIAPRNYQSAENPLLAMITILDNFESNNDVSHADMIQLTIQLLATIHRANDYVWDTPVELRMTTLNFPESDNFSRFIQDFLYHLKVPQTYINQFGQIVQGECDGYVGDGKITYLRLCDEELPPELRSTYEGPDVPISWLLLPPGYEKKERKIERVKMPRESHRRPRRRGVKKDQILHLKNLFLRVAAEKGPLSLDFSDVMDGIRNLEISKSLRVSRKNEHVIVLHKCIVEIQLDGDTATKIEIARIASKKFAALLS